MNKKHRPKPVILFETDSSMKDVNAYGPARVRHINSGKKNQAKKSRDQKSGHKASRRSCEDKRRYRDFEEAKRGLRSSKNRAKEEILDFGKTNLLASRIYECPKCKGFHLSSKPYQPRGEAA
jgi:hypothetical protein